MSRCFPYPPPGYVRNGVCGNALIDSIKIQKEREKAEKKRRKERKNEKKEKKREKQEKKEKQKYKPSEFSDGKEKKLNVDNYNQGDQSWIKSREMHLGKKIEDEAEQLEKSDLTEEHEQPSSKNYSSDGTKSGSKRKKDALLSNGNRSHGSIIRIRLPLQKHREPDASLSKEQPCTVSGRADSCFEQKSERVHSQSQEQSCSTSSGTNVRLMEAIPKLDTELLCSSSGRINSFSLDGLGTASASPLFEDEIQREELSYKALIENWVPPSQHYEQDVYDDQGWLFETKLEDQHVAKRPKASSEVSCHWTPSLWPRAHYLPEADIYALPYTVLF